MTPAELDPEQHLPDALMSGGLLPPAPSAGGAELVWVEDAELVWVEDAELVQAGVELASPMDDHIPSAPMDDGLPAWPASFPTPMITRTDRG